MSDPYVASYVYTGNDLGSIVVGGSTAAGALLVAYIGNLGGAIVGAVVGAMVGYWLSDYVSDHDMLAVIELDADFGIPNPDLESFCLYFDGGADLIACY